MSLLLRAPRLVLVHALVVTGALALAGCGSSSPSGPVGGDVPDASDQHCIVNGVMTVQTVGVCLPVGQGSADAGADGAVPMVDYGPPLYNNVGYDDDCKYKVSWTSTPIRKNEPVTFTVTVIGLDPAGPITGEGVDEIEAFMTVGVHVNPDHDTTFKSKGAGVYEVGPVTFDESGSWTVRFHIFEDCSDAPADSPHGHAAFFIDVP
jgi:hypothetical protein